MPDNDRSAVTNVNLWSSPSHALGYLSRADGIPHRAEGERELLEWLPPDMNRVLDLGSGDGRLLALVKAARPGVRAAAVDFSEAMLTRLVERFGDDTSVTIVPHDLDRPLPTELGKFEAIVSSFAIHHLHDTRKRALYREVFAHLTPGGIFCNLEHVASASRALHHRFLAALGDLPEQEDPSNKLLDVGTQLGWLREIGFEDVDCHWKWRELALLAGRKPGQ
jgi:tRNA (cmo5U34)-methyltransferase